MREIRATHKTYISKVVQHPSQVMEVQIRKAHVTARAGQYIFINCPEISYWQYRKYPIDVTMIRELIRWPLLQILSP